MALEIRAIEPQDGSVSFIVQGFFCPDLFQMALSNADALEFDSVTCDGMRQAAPNVMRGQFTVKADDTGAFLRTLRQVWAEIENTAELKNWKAI